ncbi:putative phenol monooxygenase [Trichoderma sp. SZMC 28012]
MPVFQETSYNDRDLRVNPTKEPPLPRLTLQPPLATGGEDRKYEVIIIGAGPAGMMCTLMLARYGLGDTMVCFDAKPGTLKAGQADGLQPRTLEVLKSLDVVDEILNHGCHMSEVAFWNPKRNTSPHDAPGIERTSFAPDVAVAARYKHEVTIHQGRIERILESNLNHYAPDCIHRNARFIDFQMDEAGDTEFPVKVEIELEDVVGAKTRKTARAKYLVGADGAHSVVRRRMGLDLVGETTDHIWGVVDFVVETDFPDIRKRCAIHSDAGSVMIIPRERIQGGEYLTRLYVQTTEEVSVESLDQNVEGEKQMSKMRRGRITFDSILRQAQRVFEPYEIGVKDGTQVDWWAAYQIGQRMTSKFSLKDSNGQPRIFIVGDACHTHSPKAGQGMNVSMMDSYNLSWKLAHEIYGLSPKTAGPSILSTYEDERLEIAKMLIEFDTKFSSMFSGKVNSDKNVEGLTHDQFLKVFRDGNGFTSGCGIEYSPGILVQHPAPEDCPIHGDNYLSGVLRPGRRLLDSVVLRYADANRRHLQDDFPSNGRFRILLFTTFDLCEKDGSSSQAVNRICQDLMPVFPSSTIELVVLHPFSERKFEWGDIQPSIKKYAEMRFHGPADEGLYATYGVNDRVGAAAVIRPDGYVGIVTPLQGISQMEEYLIRCLVKVEHDRLSPRV